MTSTYLGDSGIYHLHVVIVEGLSNEWPVFPAHSKPLYSNIAFALLGYVVEEITGLSYEESVAMYVTKPLRMENTTFEPLSEENMVIPPVPGNAWQTDLRDYNASVFPFFFPSPSATCRVANAAI